MSNEIFSFHWDKIRLDLMSQRSAIEGPGHQLLNVAVPTDLSAKQLSQDSQTCCQIYTVPVSPCDFLLILACLVVLLHSAGYLHTPAPNFLNNLILCSHSEPLY
jgi:hypothetical protein